MTRVRHDLVGGSESTRPASAGKSKGGGKGGGEKPQTLKLVVAVVVLLIAGGLIAAQLGLFSSAPKPLAAQPGAEADDNLNPDNPTEPAPVSTFRRQAQPVR